MSGRGTRKRERNGTGNSRVSKKKRIDSEIIDDVKDDPESFRSLIEEGTIGVNDSVYEEHTNQEFLLYEYIILNGHPSKSYPFLQILVENGFDINRPNLKGETPLMIAINHFRTNDIELLIHSGANLNAKNMKGQNILMLLFYNRYGISIDMSPYWSDAKKREVQLDIDKKRDILFSLISGGRINILETDNLGNNVLDYLLKNELIQISPSIMHKLPAWRTAILEHMLNVLPKEIMDKLIKPEHLNLSPVLSVYALRETRLPVNTTRRIGELMAGPFRGRKLNENNNSANFGGSRKTYCRQKKTRKNRQQKRKTIRRRRL
jgi:hypothetical protein